MKTFSTTLLIVAAMAFAAPAVAQEETPPDTAPAQVPAPDAPETPGAGEEAPAQPSHDWEFALSPTDRAVGASGTVQVTEGEDGNGFLVVTNALPVVDSLDTETVDVNAYTVWVVPSKDRVPESTLAGALTIDPESGEGRLEATTDLDTFGVIVTATPDGAPERIGGVAVLTGIPVQPQAQPETPEAPQAEPGAEAEPSEGEAPTPPVEPSEPPAPGDQPDKEEPETVPAPDASES